MFCYNECYLPMPPRAWSRVQNSCSLITTDESAIVPIDVLAEKNAMLNKGNILQYKANSSNLTKSQRYSKIAQGKWTNRNTTWATQSTRGYTNPNNTSLKRSGNVVNIAIDPITGAIIGETSAPVTCPTTIIYVNEGLPSNSGGGGVNNPEMPPPVEPTPESNTFPEIIEEVPVEPIVIQDEGILICSVQENVCTGETKSSISQQLCNPTTDSDVPGSIQLLCWNDGTPTWYPRQRYIMSNSTNKWPTNYKFFTSAVRPSPPVITSVTYVGNVVTLTWIQGKSCLPISIYDIYQDGLLVSTVPGTIFSTTLFVSGCDTYQYFIVGVTNGSNIPSDPSNYVTLDVAPASPPQNPIVNWASSDYYDIIMDINMNFNMPASVLCGTPSYFVLNVFNSTNVSIATQNVSYVSGQTIYEANFDNIPYSSTGTISVYLVTVLNSGETLNGEKAFCNYVSSGLPIYVNSTMSSDRTLWTFLIVTQSPLRSVAGVLTPAVLSGSQDYAYWETEPHTSENVDVSLSYLANSELGYYVSLRAGIMGLSSFPKPVGCVTSNAKGISPNSSL